MLLVGIGCVVLWELCVKARADDNPPAGRKLAFLVGVKEYKHSDLKNLDYPENDVEELASVLKQQNFSVTLLTTSGGRTNQNRLPTSENIRRQLAAILKDVSKNDLIVVGLAGHGLQLVGSSDAYFCPYDANPSQHDGKLVRPETLISIGEILAQFRDSGIGQRLLLVDACRDDPQIRSGRRSGGVTQVDFSALPPQTGVLLSCSPGEFSFENKSLGTGHGVFFFHVIEALSGVREAQDPDGGVTWDTLRSYVKRRVPRTVIKLYGKDGGEQRPNEVGNLSGEPAVLAVARITAPLPRSEPNAEPSKRMQKPDESGAKTPAGNEPALLVAPFNADQAQAARTAWGKYQQIDESRTNSIGMKLTLIPSGEFQMGSDDSDRFAVFGGEKPRHRVRITRPFYLGTYEVTKGQFRKFVDDTGYKTDAEKDGKGGVGYTGKRQDTIPVQRRADFTWRDWGVDQSDESPVVNVSHNDAVAFCEWLSKKEGKTYRLPTEAEWEYACRAGTTSLYYNGDDPEELTKIGNVADAALKMQIQAWPFSTVASSDGWAFTAPVAQFRPNNFGLYDMIGNAGEWCDDWYDSEYYRNSPVSDPTGPPAASGLGWVIRGGSWLNTRGNCRSADRGPTHDVMYSFTGFRVAAVPSGLRPQNEPSEVMSKSGKPAPQSPDGFGGTRTGQARNDNGLGTMLVWIPPGEFTMGSPKDEKGHFDNEDQVQVTLTKGFWLGQHEVTQADWRRVMRTAPWSGKAYVKEGDDYPVTYVSWDDSVSFCEKLTETEAQLGSSGGAMEIHAADRGPMGIRLPGGNQDALLVRGRRIGPWRLRLVCQERVGRGREIRSPDRAEEGESVRAVRHARECLRMVRRPFRREAVGRRGPAGGVGGRLPGAPGRELRRHGLPVGAAEALPWSDSRTSTWASALLQFRPANRESKRREQPTSRPVGGSPCERTNKASCLPNSARPGPDLGSFARRDVATAVEAIRNPCVIAWPSIELTHRDGHGGCKWRDQANQSGCRGSAFRGRQPLLFRPVATGSTR